MTHYRFMVESTPIPGQEADYHAWYNGQHTADILRLPGAKRAQRFKTVGANPDDTRYFMIVDYETDDLPGLLAEIKARSGTPDMPSSTSIDSQSVRITMLEAIMPPTDN